MTPAEARLSLGLSQDRWAELMGGTSKFTVAKWEQKGNNHRNPSMQAVELMKLLVWLHGNNPRIYEQWLREINDERLDKTI